MRTRTAVLALLATTGVALAACSSLSDGRGGSGATGSAVPSADVVGAVKADSALHDKLPASVRNAGTLTIGTSVAPGTASRSSTTPRT